MKPIEMTLCGWGSYREKTTIPFDSFGENGLFLVAGATGAGKTTIFDGIIYALYGRVSGEVREKESVRSDYCVPEDLTYVNLIFTHFGAKYEITRSPKYMRPKKRGGKAGDMVEEKEKAILKIFGSGETEKTIEGNSDVTRAVEEILRMDERQFRQTTMIAQGEFTRLLYAPPKEKTEIFRNLFGTGIYEQFTKRMRAEARRIEEEVRILGERMEEAVSHLSITTKEWGILMEGENRPYRQIHRYLTELTAEKTAQAETMSEESRRMEKETEVLQEKYNKAEEIQQRFAELLDAKTNLRRLESLGEEIDEKRELLKKAANASDLLPFKKQMEEAGQRTAALEKKRQSLFAETKRLREKQQSQNAFHQKEEALKQWLGSFSEYASCVGELEKKEKALQEALKKQKKREEEFLRLEAEKSRAHEEYLNLVKIRQRAAVGIVLKDLKEGEPCPVCGSTEHPKVAVCTEEIPDEELIERKQKQEEAAEEAYKAVFEDTAKGKEQVGQLTQGLQELETFGDGLFAELCEAWTKDGLFMLLDEPAGFFYGTKRMAAVKAASAHEKWTRLFGKLQKAWYENEKELHGKEELLCDTKNQCLEAGERLETERDGFVAAGDHVFAEAGEEILCAEKAERIEVYINYISANAMEGKQREHMQEEVQSYAAKLQSAKDGYARSAEICKSLDKVDITSIKEQLEEKKEQERELLHGLEKLRQEISFFHMAADNLSEKLEKEEALQKKYGIYQDIASAAEGKNQKRLVFEQYVLAYFFEDILRAGNRRFTQMSNRRYYMERAKEVGDGRSRDNLEIVVHDYYTGKNRSVKTLSGGEAFQASLSLALGMSDVIQSLNGGIRVETLFIDEGFGALDHEALEQACATLVSLAGQNILIGIISHVGELREQIPFQINVGKTEHGSYVEICGG